MVYRIFVEKKKALAMKPRPSHPISGTSCGSKACAICAFLNRYDVENIDEALFAYAKATVFPNRSSTS